MTTKRAAVLMLLPLGNLLCQPGCDAYLIGAGGRTVPGYTCKVPFTNFSLTLRDFEAGFFEG